MKNLLFIFVVCCCFGCDNDFGKPIGEKRVAESPGYEMLTFYKNNNCILTYGSLFDEDKYELKYKLSSDTGGTVLVSSELYFHELENHVVKINGYKYVIRRNKK